MRAFVCPYPEPRRRRGNDATPSETPSNEHETPLSDDTNPTVLRVLPLRSSSSLPVVSLLPLFRTSLTCGEQHRLVVYKLVVGSFSREGRKRTKRKKEKRRILREEGIERKRERETECADRRREPLSTAIFPRILSPHEYSLPTSIYLAATSTRSTDRRPSSRPRVLLCLSRAVVTVRENAGTVLDKRHTYRDFDRRQSPVTRKNKISIP